MSVLTLILLFCTTLIGGLLFLFVKKSNPIYLKLSLAFSGAYLFALTILHLIPEAYASGTETVGIYILAGFLLQIIIEFFSEGIEHGHIHVHKGHKGSFPIAIMFGLCVHSFFEGMPVSLAIDPSTKLNLVAGIVLHHMPVAFALMSLLIASGIPVTRSILFLSLFCLMTPLGVFVGQEMAIDAGHSGGIFSNLMGVVIGIFLHISTTILFESGDEHRFNLYKIVTILAGIGLALASF